MGIFDGYFIATDLDGTLLDREGKISKDNADAIRYFQSEGGMFSVATGRGAKFLDSYRADFIPDKYILALNGNLIYDIEKGDVISVTVADVSDLINIMDDIYPQIDGNFLRINICRKDDSYIYDGVLSGDICKVVFVLKDEEFALWLRDYLRKKYSDKFKVERSWNTGVELYSRMGGKGESVMTVKSLNPEIKLTVGIGDYENDISLLKLSDIGYAVKNSTDEAKHAADILIPRDNSQSAIAWVIDDLKRRQK